MKILEWKQLVHLAYPSQDEFDEVFDSMDEELEQELEELAAMDESAPLNLEGRLHRDDLFKMIRELAKRNTVLGTYILTMKMGLLAQEKLNPKSIIGPVPGFSFEDRN